MLMNHVNSCHGNNAFIKMQLSLSCTTKTLCISRVPMNDLAPIKIVLGCKLGQISPQVILICNELERFIYVSNANCFKSSLCSVPADKAANNVVVVCRLHYVNTLKQELDGTRAYLKTDTDEVSVVNAHLNDLPVKFSVCVNEGQDKLPTMYWLPKLHKRPYKARFIANSSSCTTTELSKLLTSCLNAIKSHVIRYCETVYETSNKNWFWSIKNSDEVLNKLKCRGFRPHMIFLLCIQLYHII